MDPMKRLLLLTALTALVTFGCGSSEDDAQSTCGTGTLCIAFPADFAGYVKWTSTPGTSDIVSDPGLVHAAGPRTVYINKRPPAGSKEFPVGTVIVKEIVTSEDVSQRKIFAMVKRGGNYNATGAANWEWFELARFADGSASIKWRGLGPPSGESYGGDKNGGCNTCHGAAKANDYVLTKGLTL